MATRIDSVSPSPLHQSNAAAILGESFGVDAGTVLFYPSTLGCLMDVAVGEGGWTDTNIDITVPPTAALGTNGRLYVRPFGVVNAVESDALEVQGVNIPAPTALPSGTYVLLDPFLYRSNETTGYPIGQLFTYDIETDTYFVLLYYTEHETELVAVHPPHRISVVGPSLEAMLRRLGVIHDRGPL